MIAMSFGCMSSAIELKYNGFDLSSGIVLKYGEYEATARTIAAAEPMLQELGIVTGAVA